jgi:adenylosuccinate synthase
MINNFTLLNLTKLDVLSDLDEIKIATSYKYNGGTHPPTSPLPLRPHNHLRMSTRLTETRFPMCCAEHLASYPSNLEILDQVEVEYETLPGWKKDVSGVRFVNPLPRPLSSETAACALPHTHAQIL